MCKENNLDHEILEQETSRNIKTSKTRMLSGHLHETTKKNTLTHTHTHTHAHTDMHKHNT